MFRLSCLALIAVIGACGRGAAVVDAGPLPPGPSAITPAVSTKTPDSPSPERIAAAPLSFAPIARGADRGVVTINTVGEEVDGPFSRRRRARELKGLGTGFIISRDGIIVTNNHVIEGAESISVKLSDERVFAATVVGRDPPTDMAVLRIDAKELVPLPLGDSDVLDVGDWVVAIGNPFGLSHTVSAGIVSAKGRTREDVPLDPAGYYSFIQTDASINPGNSGGPLLNLHGEVVGINSAIRGGGAQGIGFAIPINMVKQLLPMLLRDGHVTRSAIGVQIRDIRELSDEDRVQLKIVDPNGALLVTGGAVIIYVAGGGPADRAGLAPGDIITSFEGQPIDRSAKLQWLASTLGVGKTASLRVLRDGKTVDVKVTLGQLEAGGRRR